LTLYLKPLEVTRKRFIGSYQLSAVSYHPSVLARNVTDTMTAHQAARAADS